MKQLYSKLFFTLLCFAILSNANAQEAQTLPTDQNVEQDSTKTEMPEYRRSSVYSVLIKQPTMKHGNTIDSVFMSIPMSDKFNNHDIDTKSFESTTAKAKRKGKKKEAGNATDIATFIDANRIPAQLVAKWFNRDSEDGSFDMDLIHERGYYDASQDAISQAENNHYGKEILADAGGELIGKTFMLVNDITFSDTGEKTAKAAGWLKIAGAIAGAATGVDLTSATDLAAGIVNEFDGFGVNITSYLYCLDWDDNKLTTFYETMWHDSESVCPTKKARFDTTSLFTLRYVGRITTTAKNIASKSLSTRSEQSQLTKVCARAIDKSIVELQREYDEFKVNVPIGNINTDGTVEVAVGLKEGLNEKSEYEVLMPMEAEDGNTMYDKIGKITPVKGKIWDNRFGALEEHEAMKEADEKVEDAEGAGSDATLTASTFKIISGQSKIVSGCLVREVTIKR